MRRFFLLAAVLLLASVPAKAQEYPSVEIFGGYSYLNTTTRDARDGVHGFGVSFASNLGSQWGLVGELSVHDGKTRLPTLTRNTNLKKYTYLFGPRFSARGDKATAFGHVLLGAANSTVEGVGRSTGFALALGGGVDLNLSKSVALPLFRQVGSKRQGPGRACDQVGLLKIRSRWNLEFPSSIRARSPEG